MDGQPFSRTIINPRERPLSGDINSAQAQLDRTVRDLLLIQGAGRASAASPVLATRSGFLGDSFRVMAKGVPELKVDIQNGLGFIYDAASVGPNVGGIQGLDDYSALKPAWLPAPITFNVPAAPVPGQSRIDIIQVKANREVGNALTRDVLDATTGVFASQNVNKTLTWDLTNEVQTAAPGDPATGAIVYRQGTAAATGAEVEPATDAGYEKIAAILVAGGATQIENKHIIDYRALWAQDGILRVGARMRMASFGVLSDLEFFAPPGVTLGVMQEASLADQNFKLVVKMGDTSRWTIAGVLVSGGTEVEYLDNFNTDTPMALTARSMYRKYNALNNVPSQLKVTKTGVNAIHKVEQDQVGQAGLWAGITVYPAPFAAAIGQPIFQHHFTLRGLKYIVGGGADGWVYEDSTGTDMPSALKAYIDIEVVYRRSS